MEEALTIGWTFALYFSEVRSQGMSGVDSEVVPFPIVLCLTITSIILLGGI